MKIIDLEKWAPHVGMFMLEFGAVESFTQKLLKELTSSAIYKQKKELPLKTKIKEIIKILEKSDNYQDLRIDLIQSYKHIEGLVQVRNTIAHSTVNLVFWENIQPGQSPCDEAIYSDKKPNKAKTITLDEIKTYNAQLSALVENLYHIDAIKRGRKISEDLEYLKMSGINFVGFSRLKD